MKDPGSTEAKSAKRQLQKRVLLALGSVVVYAAAFFPIYALISRSAIALSILPITLIAVTFGTWAGLFTGLALVPINIALIATAEHSSPGLFVGRIFWVSHIVFVAMGIAMGYLNHIRVKSASELAERQRVEQALQESETKYRNVAERATDGIAIIQDNVVKYCNPQTAEMVGYTVQEILDAPFARFLSPDQRASLLARYQRRLEGKDEPQRYEIELVHRSGHHIPVEINAGLTEYEGHRATLAIIRDMSTHQQAQQALRESERRYRALFERTNDAIFLLDLQGDHIQVNQRAADLLGYTPEEMIGMSFEQIVAPREYPDAQEKLSMLLAGEIPPLYERVFRHRDGTEIPVEVNVALVYDTNGNPSHIQSIIRDISERKRAEMALRESEERLRTLIECIPVEFWAKDTSGHYIMQNSANRQVYGDTIGLTLDDIDVDQEIRAEWQAQDERIFAGETVHSEHILSIRGEERVFQQVVAPVRIEDRVVAILGIIFDVTEQRKAEEALRHAVESAEAANRARSAFLANVSHELRTPLNAILGFSELILRDTNLSAEQERGLRTIHNSGNDLLQLINQILALSRNEQQTALDDADDLFRPQALAQSSDATKHERETLSPQAIAQGTAQPQSQLEEPNPKALSEPEVVKSLASMPDRWLADLHQAIIEGDIGWMSSLIDGISDRRLAEHLAALVDSFKHSELLSLLEQANDSSPEEYNGQAAVRS